MKDDCKHAWESVETSDVEVEGRHCPKCDAYQFRVAVLADRTQEEG